MRGGGYRFEPASLCLCGTRGGVAAASGVEAGRQLRLLLCPTCGLGRLSPRLAPGELDRYYRSDYRTLLRGTPRIDDEDFERGVRRGHRLLAYLAERDCLPAAGGLVAEIGTGSGGILATFAERGYAVTGSDLDPHCVAYAQGRGLNVIRGEDLAPSDRGPAALVVLSHLIEHLPDPRRTLRALERHCDQRTLLYVELPGLRAPDGAGQGLRLPHLYYYDLTTLRWLLAEFRWRLEHGDEEIRAVFRRGEVEEVDLEGNFQRNLSALGLSGEA